MAPRGFALTFLALVTFVLASASAVAQPDTARIELEKLRARYEGITSAHVVVHPLTTTAVHADTVARSDGSFRTFNFEMDKSNGGGNARKRPYHFLFVTPELIVEANSPSGSSYDLRPSSVEEVAESVEHFDRVPWPKVASWCEALMASSDLEYERNGDEHVASSRNARVSISWGDNGEFRVLQMALGEQDGFTRLVYSGFDRMSRGVPLPRQLVQTWAVPESPRLSAYPPFKYSYSRTELNPPDADALLVFDAEALRTIRHDPATDKYYAADGELVTWERALLSYSHWKAVSPRPVAPWWTLAGAGAIALVILWRFRRRLFTSRSAQPSPL